MASATAWVKVSGTWQRILHWYYKLLGTWQQVKFGYVKVSGVWQLVYAYIVPYTDNYDTPGTYNVDIPAGANQLVVYATGGGGSGAAQVVTNGTGGSGGSAGGTAIRTIPIDPADWGNTAVLVVGAGGAAVTEGSIHYDDGNDGNDSTFNLTVTAGTFSMTGGKGNKGFSTPHATGGTASGGSVNNSGGDSTNDGSSLRYPIGGDSYWAAGGAGFDNNNGTGNGNAGSYGSGGGAGYNTVPSSSGKGGDGRIQLCWS